MDGRLITGGPRPDGFQPHLGLICGNLTPPVGGKPALLTHREVETIFHEFGHLLHHLLSRVEIRTPGGHQRGLGFRGAALADHGELVLGARRAGPVRAPLGDRRRRSPTDLFEKMKRARTFRAANAQMRQLGFGFVDLLLHTRYDPARDGDPVGLHAPPPAGVQPRAAAAVSRHDRGLHPPVRRARWATAPATTRINGPRCWMPTPSPASAKASSPARWAPLPRRYPLPRRQRRPGGALPPLHGPGSRSARAAGPLRPGVAAGPRNRRRSPDAPDPRHD